MSKRKIQELFEKMKQEGKSYRDQDHDFEKIYGEFAQIIVKNDELTQQKEMLVVYRQLRDAFYGICEDLTVCANEISKSAKEAANEPFNCKLKELTIKLTQHVKFLVDICESSKKIRTHIKQFVLDNNN